MKTGAYEDKFVYYVLPFLLAGTYVKKVLYYVLCKCHNRTYWTFSCPYVPFDFCRRTFCYLFVYMSHTDVPTGYFWHLFVHMSHLSYTGGYFFPFFVHMSHLVLLAAFLHGTVEEKMVDYKKVFVWEKYVDRNHEKWISGRLAEFISWRNNKTRMNWYFRPLAKCPIKRLKKD